MREDSDLVEIKDFGDYETAWCPGCGNFGILNALKKALVKLECEPHRVMFFSGIGQAAKLPHYINANLFNGLHGRALPMATAAKLVNPEMLVIAGSGDGCHFAEGGNHFLHAVRRNADIVMLHHNNQIYGLTQGQASPTTDRGMKTKAQPLGAPSYPILPTALAVAMKAGFVARGFAGDLEHLADMIVAAAKHKGFAMVDILQPCVSFNRVNTWKWLRERTYKLDQSYDPTSWQQAIWKSEQWGDRIPLGIIYRNEGKEVFGKGFPAFEHGPLTGRETERSKIRKIMQSFA